MSKHEPDYYAHNGLSPIGAFKQGLLSQEELIGFYKGNIIKYVIRAGKKGDAVKDLKKAKDYINFYMDIFKMTSEEQAELNKELIHLGNFPVMDDSPNFPPVKLESSDVDPKEVEEKVIEAFEGLNKIKEVE